MKTIMVGTCAYERLFKLSDPDAPPETEFEAVVVRALQCIYPDYLCIVFTGSFLHEGRVAMPDLALIARDYSHWFIIEVELASHSLVGHVLPQVRAFKYGEPQGDCITILKRELEITRAQAETLLWQVPRTIAVIANKRDSTWQVSLAALPVQYAIVSLYQAPNGVEAIEFDGTLEVLEENLGFGTYSATERCLLFPAAVRLPDGEVQIHDPSGSAGLWTVRRDDGSAWIMKEGGAPSIGHGLAVQLIRTYRGEISLRLPGAPVARR